MEHGTRAMSVGLRCQCELCFTAFPDEHRPEILPVKGEHRKAPPRGPDVAPRPRRAPKPEPIAPERPSGPVSTKKPPPAIARRDNGR